MSALLKVLWRITFRPFYDRLFRRYFQGTIDHLNAISAQVGAISAQVGALDEQSRTQAAVIRHQSDTIVDYGAELRTHTGDLAKRVTELDAQVRVLLAARWEHEALARRIAKLEDHLSSDALAGPRSKQAGRSE